MAGTISISLQQQLHTSTGLPLSGGRLDIFQAGTISTRQNAFRESSLVNPYANPIILESDGRIPHLWFADGGIKIRLSDTTGIVQFEADNLPVIGSSGGGGGVDTTDVNAIFTTGMPLWMPSTGTKTGWTRMNARTVGSATSGATERANADCEQQFLHLWNNFPDTICPVSTGRGISAAADWAANKNIGTINMRGKGAFGLNDMGNSDSGEIAAGFISVGNGTTGGSSGGADGVALLESQLAAHDHDIGELDIGGSITPSATVKTYPNTINNVPSGGGASNAVADNGSSAVNFPVTDLTVTGSTADAGSGAEHTNMPPFVLGTWFMRL